MNKGLKCEQCGEVLDRMVSVSEVEEIVKKEKRYCGALVGVRSALDKDVCDRIIRRIKNKFTDNKNM